MLFPLEVQMLDQEHVLGSGGFSLQLWAYISKMVLILTLIAYLLWVRGFFTILRGVSILLTIKTYQQSAFSIMMLRAWFAPRWSYCRHFLFLRNPHVILSVFRLTRLFWFPPNFFPGLLFHFLFSHTSGSLKDPIRTISSVKLPAKVTASWKVLGITDFTIPLICGTKPHMYLPILLLSGVTKCGTNLDNSLNCYV